MKKMKLTALTLLAATAAMSASAQTNYLLQSIDLDSTVHWQGPTNSHPTYTNYTAEHYFFGTKDLAPILKGAGFASGDVVVRATVITNIPVYVTNIVPVSTTNLVVTNISASEEIVSNAVLFGGSSNFIGSNNLTFGPTTNTVVINGTNVTPTNIVSVLYDSVTYTFDIGTNTTVTTTILTNSAGNSVGTSNFFVINSLPVTGTGTNALGAVSWAIYNPHTTPKLTPISTNVYFTVQTDEIHGLTNLAKIHGETIKNNGRIEYGTTYEIRTLVLSNSGWNILLQGYAQGQYVPVSLGGNDTVFSRDFSWVGSGSGVSNSVPIVIDATIREQYFKHLTE